MCTFCSGHLTPAMFDWRLTCWETADRLLKGFVALVWMKLRTACVMSSFSVCVSIFMLISRKNVPPLAHCLSLSLSEEANHSESASPPPKVKAIHQTAVKPLNLSLWEYVWQTSEDIKAPRGPKIHPVFVHTNMFLSHCFLHACSCVVWFWFNPPGGAEARSSSQSASAPTDAVSGPETAAWSAWRYHRAGFTAVDRAGQTVLL